MSGKRLNRYLYLGPVGLAIPFLLFPNRWTWLAFGAAAVACLIYWRRTGQTYRHTPLDAPVVFILLTAMMGTIVAIDTSLASNRFWNIVLQCAVFFLIVQFTQTDWELKSIIRLLLVAIFVLECVALVGTDWSVVRLYDSSLYQSLPNLFPPLPNSGLTTPKLINPRAVGGALGFLTPFAVGCVFWKPFGRTRWFALLIALFGSILIVLSQAPMGVLALLAGLNAFAFLRFHRLGWFYLAFTILFIIASRFIDWSPILTIAFDESHPLGIAILLRIDMWRQAISMLNDMPFTGIGLNNFPLILSDSYPGYLIGLEVNPHNTFLQTALDLGIWGFLAFVWFFGSFLIWAFRATTPYQPILYGSAAAVVAFLVGGLGDSLAIGQKPVLLIWVIVGIATVILYKYHPVRPRRALISIVVPLLVILMIWFALPTVRSRNEATLLAHQQLLRGSAWRAPEATLDRAILANSNHPRLYSMRARILAEEGDYTAALIDLEQRSILDQKDPVRRYAPFITWQATPLPGSLSAIYRQWHLRYPDRADYYVLSAMVASETSQEGIIAEGIARSARPLDLLETFATHNLE